jgi:sterol desaturase/sphingolipid hydroxylase (fatty acid hydroxylase superfamily)
LHSRSRSWCWGSHSVLRAGRRRGLGTDVIYWFFTPLVSRTLAIVGLGIVAVAMAAMAGVPLDGPHIKAYLHRATWFADLPIAAQIALVVVLGDFIGYWAHRAFHRGRLWRFHAIHHASRDLDWLSATRLHPVNDILQRAVQAVPLFALGFDATVLAAYVPALALYAIGLHANVSWSFGPLRYVIASPRFHRWHHTSEAQGIDKNFAGLLPVWDLMFGTFHMPAGRVPLEFGVHDEIPDGIVGQLAWPFKRASPAGTRHSSRAA